MNKDFELDFYATPRGERPALEFIRSLDKRARNAIGSRLTALEEVGPNLRRPAADVLSGPIRELRISVGHNEYRLLYFIAGRMIIVTNGFQKKTWAVDPLEIDRARRRREDWLSREAPHDEQA